MDHCRHWVNLPRLSPFIHNFMFQLSKRPVVILKKDKENCVENLIGNKLFNFEGYIY